MNRDEEQCTIERRRIRRGSTVMQTETWTEKQDILILRKQSQIKSYVEAEAGFLLCDGGGGGEKKKDCRLFTTTSGFLVGLGFDIPG